MPPPPGEVSNLDNPPNSNHLALGVQVGTFVITTIFFLLRMYGRVVMLRKFQAEESECFPPTEALRMSMSRIVRSTNTLPLGRKKNEARILRQW